MKFLIYSASNFADWPIVQGKYYLYGTYFVAEYMINFLYWSALVFLAWMVFRLIAYIIEKCEKKKSEHNSNNSSVNPEELENGFMEKKSTSNKPKLDGLIIAKFFFLRISEIFSWISVLIFSAAFTAFSALDVIPIVATMFIMLFINLTKLCYNMYKSCPSSHKKPEDSSPKKFGKFYCKFCQVLKIQFKLHPIQVAIQITLLLAFCIAVPILTAGFCLAYFNTDFGIVSNTLQFSLSTRIVRTYDYDQVCPQGTHCHVYATLAGDASNNVFINVHTGIDIDSVMINYYPNALWLNDSNITPYQVNATMFDLSFLETLGQRNVHTALLQNLTSETLYKLQLVYNGNVQDTKYYKTLPGLGSTTNITMAIGGDSGTTQAAQNGFNVANDKTPDVYLIGGDWAYDNGLHSCYYTWDSFLWIIEKQNQSYLTPMFGSVGNHDVGMNSMSGALINKENPPLFITYIPQHLDPITQGVPELPNRVPYSIQKIGNTAHVTLDSGYLVSYQDQAAWLNDTLNNLTSSGYSVFVNYHNPIYPACYSTENPASTADDSDPEKYWVPLFDQYRVQSVFENHVHLFKKTFPLTNSTIDEEDGIIYFGDGNIGVLPSTCEINGNATGLLEIANRTNHIWIINVNNTMVSYTPWSIDNHTVIDTIVQDLKIQNFIDLQ